MIKDAVLLAGSLGLGHEMMARSCAGLLELSGWRTLRLDSMSLLGRRSGRASERLFGRLVSLPGLYDGRPVRVMPPYFCRTNWPS